MTSETNRHTRRPRIIVFAAFGAFLAAVLVALALVLSGVVSFAQGDKVPCNGLTMYDQVQAAMTDHADVLQRIRSVGSGSDVTVEPIRANCPATDGQSEQTGQADQLGYLRITYVTDAERDAIQNILSDATLGMWATLENR